MLNSKHQSFYSCVTLQHFQWFSNNTRTETLNVFTVPTPYLIFFQLQQTFLLKLLLLQTQFDKGLALILKVNTDKLLAKFHNTRGGHFKNSYELFNQRALKISTWYENHIFQCMGNIFCVEFHRYPLKFLTKYLSSKRYAFYTKFKF